MEDKSRIHGDFSAKTNQTLCQLYEIFGYVADEDVITNICLESKGNFEICVEKLIKYADKRSNLKISYQNENLSNKKQLLNSMENLFEFHISNTKKTQGAIPKSSNFLASDQITNIPTFTQTNLRLKKDFENVPNFETVINHIDSGHKIMIIMRGAPGSGKSYLAEKIIDLTVNQEYGNFIFSTDDYFYKANKYIYQIEKLSEAHDFNQRRVRKKATEGWSPIIVDNTSTKIWEMLPYVKIAIQNGYIIELLEPKTPWRNSAYKLSIKNSHNVPKTKIESILNNFEYVTKEQILKIVQKNQISISLPQMRTFPNIPMKVTNPPVNNIPLTLDCKNDILKDHNKTYEIVKPPDRTYHETSLRKEKSLESYYEHTLNQDDNEIHKNKKQDETIEHENNQVLLEEHAPNCTSENKLFQLLRQIYPQKNVNALWDLFKKCNGDIEWVIEILIRDDDENFDEIVNIEENNLKCKCEQKKKNYDSELLILKNVTNINRNPKIPKSKKLKDSSSTSMLDINKILKNDTDIAYKFRDENLSNLVLNSVMDENNQEYNDLFNETKIDSSECDDNLIIEIKLGKELIQQLEDLFGSESSQNTLTNYQTNILIPKLLAKQLHALWMQSIFHQIEENKHKIIKEDEEFAKLVDKFSIESDFMNNTKDNVADMELAWLLYNSDQQNFRNSNTENLASHLTRLKLYEMFPEIEKDTLLEIFQAHNNRFDDTVKTLKNSINNDANCKTIKTNNFTNYEEIFETEEEIKQQTELNYKKMLPEDAKRAALRDFEENRNFAAHHSQLKAECFEKAKDAIQQNNTSVAVYYSQIANLHKSKIDMYNHNAANCIIKVNDLTQNNPDFIDLHYLHTTEAIQCLDIFLDKHIRKLRCISRIYKYIFVITGRGLHSAGGISSIKNKVKTRLKDRNLKWSEVNPGLLKVKLFSASKFSENF